MGKAAGWPSAESAQAEGWQGLSDWGAREAAPPHAICVFVPLIDLTETNGYTVRNSAFPVCCSRAPLSSRCCCQEFWAGTHGYDGLLEKKGAQALPGGTKGITPAGSCLCYDFRNVHRGMPNTSSERRPILYFVYSHAGFSEGRNFRVGNSVFRDKDRGDGSE